MVLIQGSEQVQQKKGRIRESLRTCAYKPIKIVS